MLDFYVGGPPKLRYQDFQKNYFIKKNLLHKNLSFFLGYLKVFFYVVKVFFLRWHRQRKVNYDHQGTLEITENNLKVIREISKCTHK